MLQFSTFTVEDIPLKVTQGHSKGHSRSSVYT